MLGSTCVVCQIQAVYWTHLPERDTHAMIGWTVPSSRASVGKGQMQQIEQYLVHLQMKKGQGMPLSRLEERYLHDHEFLEERAAALVHEQLGGRMGLVTDLNKFSETLDNMPPIDEENDAYGLMPVETDYQTGYHVSLSAPVSVHREERREELGWKQRIGNAAVEGQIFMEYLYEKGVEF